MLKNKKWLVWVAVAVAVVVVIVSAAVLVVAEIKREFASPGAHRLFNYVGVNIESKCYHFDGATYELLRQGTLTLKGHGELGKRFEGTLTIPEYSNPETYTDPDDQPDNTYCKIENQMIQPFRDAWYITIVELYERHAGRHLDEYQTVWCDYWYVVYWDAEGDYAAIRVYDPDQNNVAIIICADNEAQARERLEKRFIGGSAG